MDVDFDDGVHGIEPDLMGENPFLRQGDEDGVLDAKLLSAMTTNPKGIEPRIRKRNCLPPKDVQNAYLSVIQS